MKAPERTDIVHYTIRINERNKIFDIESEKLIYSDMISHYGLQCNQSVYSVNYDKIRRRCEEVIQLMREIHKLNQILNETN